LAAVLIAVPVTAVQAMTVATFLQKAEALEARGALALLSSDFTLLKNEVATASQSLRAERLARQRAARRPAYCPPDNSSVTPAELLASFRAIPAAQRPRMEVREGLRRLLMRKFPCRA
jgi:hypothetical protein